MQMQEARVKTKTMLGWCCPVLAHLLFEFLLQLPGPAKASHDSPRTPNVKISGPGASNTAKIPRKDPQERGRKKEHCGGRGKNMREILGPPPFGAHFSGFAPSSSSSHNYNHNHYSLIMLKKKNYNCKKIKNI